MTKVSLGDLSGCFQVKDLSMDILESEGDEVVACVDLQVGESGETEVCRSTGEDEGDGLVKIARGLYQRRV